MTGFHKMFSIVLLVPDQVDKHDDIFYRAK